MTQEDSVQNIKGRLGAGAVIPQMPLPLDSSGKLDETAARNLIRYYLASGATGLAVGCWPMRALGSCADEAAMLRMAALAREETSGADALLVAGLSATHLEFAVACREAGCDALVIAAEDGESLDQLLVACQSAAGVLPILGVAFPPAWRHPLPPQEFYAELLALPTLAALIVPGNTGAGLRSAVAAWRNDAAGNAVPLLLGDGDRFLADLLTPADAESDETVPLFAGVCSVRAAFWTDRLVAVADEARRVLSEGEALDPATLTLALQLGDIHDAVFDAANGGAGALAGMYDVLAWGDWVSPDAGGPLQPGQRERIDAIFKDYPHFVDDEGEEDEEDDD